MNKFVAFPCPSVSSVAGEERTIVAALAESPEHNVEGAIEAVSETRRARPLEAAREEGTLGCARAKGHIWGH